MVSSSTGRVAVAGAGPSGLAAARALARNGIDRAGCELADSEPNVPTPPGGFGGPVLHSSACKRPQAFAGRRVLVVGAGNSGCDIAVDLVHHAAAVDISVRRGNHVVPKYVLGRPADTLSRGRPLPPRITQFVDLRYKVPIRSPPGRRSTTRHASGSPRCRPDAGWPTGAERPVGTPRRCPPGGRTGWTARRPG